MSIRYLPDVSMADVAQVGGKAGSLGQLLQAGFTVPTGFVVCADSQKMTDKLAGRITQAFDHLALQRVAVRSSGVSEDAHDQSWAGQFATFLHVTRAGLVDAVKACWDSAKSDRVRAYGQADKLAVLVQQMVESDVSGVAFSINPLTGDDSQMMVEAVYGLCEPLVQGAVTPDNYVLGPEGEVLSQDIAVKQTQLIYHNGKTVEATVDSIKQQQPALSTTQLHELAKLVRSVAAHYGHPVDIEWAYQHNQLYLLQARPITT